MRCMNEIVIPLQTLRLVKDNEAPVAQLDRVADFESVGRRFESYRARHILLQKNDRFRALSSAGRATDS